MPAREIRSEGRITNDFMPRPMIDNPFSRPVRRRRAPGSGRAGEVGVRGGAGRKWGGARREETVRAVAGSGTAAFLVFDWGMGDVSGMLGAKNSACMLTKKKAICTIQCFASSHGSALLNTLSEQSPSPPPSSPSTEEKKKEKKKKKRHVSKRRDEIPNY